MIEQKKVLRIHDGEQHFSVYASFTCTQWLRKIPGRIFMVSKRMDTDGLTSPKLWFIWKPHHHRTTKINWTCVHSLHFLDSNSWTIPSMSRHLCCCSPATVRSRSTSTQYVVVPILLRLFQVTAYNVEAVSRPVGRHTRFRHGYYSEHTSCRNNL